MSFKSTSIRPTSDKVREAIFNILPTPFPFKNVLDLFAGTGALGIESLSRGAETVVFVDIDTAVLNDNLEKCGIASKVKVLKRDALSSIKGLLNKLPPNNKFDLVFLDPPYKDFDLIDKSLASLDKEGVITDDCFVVCEVSSKEVIDKDFISTVGFEFIKDKKYGDTTVLFFQKR